METRAYEKGNLLTEGKTKWIHAVQDHPEFAWVIEKEEITAFDNKKFTKRFATKALSATATTCRVFELLRDAGIPVAYQEQLSPTEFLVQRCRMIPVEAVARRLAVGSYLDRHPHMKAPGDVPQRFHRLVTEFFLKTTGGKLVMPDGRILVEGLDPEKKEEDPFIRDPSLGTWGLSHSKKPLWDPTADLKRSVERRIALLDCETGDEARLMVKDMEELLRKVFLVLEGAWASLGFHLVDLKIEFGLDASGRLRVADVIDNDSWRLRDGYWKELSKEVFRQGASLEVVEANYSFVASLVERFHFPKQALVLWRGSDKDSLPNISNREFLRGKVEVLEVVQSAHKQPQAVLNQLEGILNWYPGGGVIIAKVGRSNGLGPLLAGRSSWPVITVPAALDTFPDDIWSSVRMPSDIPLLTAWPDGNAIMAALNILARKNPFLYMQQQYALEERDQ